MSGTKLKFVPPRQLRKADVNWILKGAEKQELVGKEEVANSVLAGVLGVLRMEGDAEGVLLYKQIRHGEGDELQLWMVSGRGYIVGLDGIVGEFEKFAQEKKCKWVGCYVSAKGLSRLIERRLKLRPKVWVYRKEIGNG